MPDPLSDADKLAIGRTLRDTLRGLPANVPYTTNELVRTIWPAAGRDIFNVVIALAKAGYADRGEPKASPFDPSKTVRPWIWTRRDIPEPKPIQSVRLTDVVGTVIGRRGETGTFGPASSVRRPYVTTEEFEAYQEQVSAQLALVFDLISAQENQPS